LVTKAAGYGIHIVAEDFIKTRPLGNEALREQIKQLAAQPLAVVFTSAHAVNAVFSLLSIQPEWLIFCMSGATKTAVLAFMPENAIVSTGDCGEELAEKILSGKNTRSFCFFCGNRRFNAIPEKLNAARVPFRELVVYETELQPKKINQHYDGILFFSPSAAESFFSLNRISEETVLFSIVKTTEAVLKKYSQNRIITSETPKADLLIDQVLHFNFKATGPHKF
jgi:uroporphyrinogen-III synthase